MTKVICDICGEEIKGRPIEAKFTDEYFEVSTIDICDQCIYKCSLIVENYE